MLRSTAVFIRTPGTPDELDETALVEILTKPKNALVKQYQKLFEFEDVRLRLSDGAIRAVARQALLRNAGARGLRSILVGVMLDLMYDIPSRDDGDVMEDDLFAGIEARSDAVEAGS